jgi:hypothetical protein
MAGEAGFTGSGLGRPELCRHADCGRSHNLPALPDAALSPCQSSLPARCGRSRRAPWCRLASAPLCRPLPARGTCRRTCSRTADAGTPHQLRLRRLVRIVALQAVGGAEGLAVMRLLQARILDVVAIDAERRQRPWSGENRNSILPTSPVLWVTWQVSQPMSSAAWRLPFSGTFNPLLWQSDRDSVLWRRTRASAADSCCPDSCGS